MATIIKSSGGIRKSSGLASMSLAGPGLRATTLPGGRVALTATAPRTRGTPRTFFVTGSGANVKVTAGAINNVVYAGGTITAPANGDKIYIDATISGVTVTAVTVSKGATVPASTTTHQYTLLATVAVASSIATPTPLAWNYSQLQICAGQGLWGGFGA